MPKTASLTIPVLDDATSATPEVSADSFVSPSTDSTPESPIIQITDLTKRYGYGDASIFALDHFSLEVKRGEFIMIMGPSGCGKTTLLNIIGLLDKPTDGTYLLNDQPVESISARKKAKLRAKKIGMIFQSFNLIPTLPILENVALPLVYSGVTKTNRLIQASNALDRFHLKEREYYLPTQLSGGQQQRVAIARSLVNKPEIILADEPTGNLDSRSSHIVMEELRTIHQAGNTIIMVTHNPALTAYATRVINMLDGHIDTDIKTVRDQDLPQPIKVRRVKGQPAQPNKAAKTTKTAKSTKATAKSAKKAGAKSSKSSKSPKSSKKPKSAKRKGAKK